MWLPTYLRAIHRLDKNQNWPVSWKNNEKGDVSLIGYFAFTANEEESILEQRQNRKGDDARSVEIPNRSHDNSGN